MKIVLGLGNPGDTYRATRHNIGFWVIDRVARRLKGFQGVDIRGFGSTGMTEAHAG